MESLAAFLGQCEFAARYTLSIQTAPHRQTDVRQAYHTPNLTPFLLPSIAPIERIKIVYQVNRNNLSTTSQGRGGWFL